MVLIMPGHFIRLPIWQTVVIRRIDKMDKMKRIVQLLCFLIFFSILYTLLIQLDDLNGRAYAEVKKPGEGAKTKTDCNECHSKLRAMKKTEKAVAGDKIQRDADGKPVAPPDHIKKDKRINKGLQ
jgi:hypothetical protein